jgi:sulfur carrier protein
MEKTYPAEIIPFEPDTCNEVEGNKLSHYLSLSPPTILGIMEIQVNNETVVAEHPFTVHQLLSKLQLTHSKGIAVAVNNRVVSRSLWEDHSLNEKDKITIIKASAGG